MNSAEQSGQGVFVLDGQMIDNPVIERARRIQNMAQHFELGGDEVD